MNDKQTTINTMTKDDLNEILTKRVTCRPGMKFVIVSANWMFMESGRYLQYQMEVPNTYHPEQTTKLYMTGELPEFVVTVEDFFDYCEAIALWFDDHEGREWFKVDGKPLHDPHIFGGATNVFDKEKEFRKVKAIREIEESYTGSWGRIY